MIRHLLRCQTRKGEWACFGSRGAFARASDKPTVHVKFLDTRSDDVTSVARNLTWTVGLSLSRAKASLFPKQATDRPCVKASGAPIARPPESPFPFPCRRVLMHRDRIVLAFLSTNRHEPLFDRLSNYVESNAYIFFSLPNFHAIFKVCWFH